MHLYCPPWIICLEYVEACVFSKVYSIPICLAKLFPPLRTFIFPCIRIIVIQVIMSADLTWQIIRKNSCFLRRQRGIQKHFSVEPFNLRGLNSPRFNGLISKKGMDIAPAKDGKGVVVSLKVPGISLFLPFLFCRLLPFVHIISEKVIL